MILTESNGVIFVRPLVFWRWSDDCCAHVLCTSVMSKEFYLMTTHWFLCLESVPTALLYVERYDFIRQLLSYLGSTKRNCGFEAYVSSDGPDQTAHSRSLIRTIAFRRQNHWIIKNTLTLHGANGANIRMSTLIWIYACGIRSNALFLLKRSI